MDATFIIVFHTQRFDNVLQTLRFLHHNHADVIKDCQLVTVCQDEVNASNLKDVKFDTQEFEDNQAIGEFNYWSRYFGRWDHFDMNLKHMQLPKVTNFGVEKSVADKLVIIESDRVLPYGYFEKVLGDLQEGKQITTLHMQTMLEPASDEDIKANNFKFKQEIRSTNAQIGRRSVWSGNTSLMKKDFYRVGKMDEMYEGYGWADNDMTLTMEAAGVESIFRQETEIHLWHPRATYDGDKNSSDLFIHNGMRYCDKWNIEPPDWLKKKIEKIRRKYLI